MISVIARAALESARSKRRYEGIVQWCQVLIENDMNATSRESAKVVILLILESKNPFKYKDVLEKLVKKLKDLGVAEDIKWLQRHEPIPQPEVKIS